MRPKIISLGFAAPQFIYTQEEVFSILGYPRHFWRIFRDSMIDTRHFCLSLELAKCLSFQEQQEQYLTLAPGLAKGALLSAQDNVDLRDISLLTYSTCTGFPPGPTVCHILARDLNLRSDLRIDNLGSQGCEGAFPGLASCYDFVALRPGVVAAAIACELTCLTYYPEPYGEPDPENDYELLRSNAVFADACSCALIGYDDDPRHPEILDFSSAMDTAYMSELGYIWRNGRLRVRLSKRVPELATELLDKAIHSLLLKNKLTVNDIAYWVFHPPGVAVLNKVRDQLGISEEKLKYSRRALRMYGNTSSASVGIVGKLLIGQEANPEGYLVMANVGPGMTANAVLARFGN